MTRIKLIVVALAIVAIMVGAVVLNTDVAYASVCRGNPCNAKTCNNCVYPGYNIPCTSGDVDMMCWANPYCSHWCATK